MTAPQTSCVVEPEGAAELVRSEHELATGAGLTYLDVGLVSGIGIVELVVSVRQGYVRQSGHDGMGRVPLHPDDLVAFVLVRDVVVGAVADVAQVKGIQVESGIPRGDCFPHDRAERLPGVLVDPFQSPVCRWRRRGRFDSRACERQRRDCGPAAGATPHLPVQTVFVEGVLVTHTDRERG